MWMAIDEQLHLIKPGDVILFIGNARNIGHLIIMLAQKFNGGDEDGFSRAVHCGIVVRWHGVLHLAEFRLTRLLPWPRGGMVLTELQPRLDEYPHGIVHLWLDTDAREKFDSVKLTQFVNKVKDYYYNIPGLIFAILRLFVGWQRAGAYFCSEFVRDALSEAGAWNGERGLLVKHNGKPKRVDARIEPQRFSPWDIARARVFADWRVVE